ncbi:ImmA/IrrE family metallo-endopeptidase [Roseibium sp. MB-4]
MSKRISPTRWAIDISIILNAIPNFQRFPINVAEVAKEISHKKFPNDPITLIKGKDLPGFEGAMKKAPKGKSGWGIFYNSGMRSKGRINFTLAHEFGHYLLHRIEHPNGFMCSIEDMSKWDSQYAKLEGEANTFAANLLMPLDDFRDQVHFNQAPEIEALSECAKRYGVSLIACILRWLSYTAQQAVLVISRDEFILWARSSEAALKSGLFFRTQGRSPIPVPTTSLANNRNNVEGHTGSIIHGSNSWFGKPCREQAIFSEQYDFTISLLFFDNERALVRHDDAETVEDTYERFQRRNPSQSWS